jgi:hypothetical protein
LVGTKAGSKGGKTKFNTPHGNLLCDTLSKTELMQEKAPVVSICGDGIYL